MVVGGAVAAMSLGPATDRTVTAGTVAASVGVTASRDSDDRASRGKARTAPASPSAASPSASPSPSPSRSPSPTPEHTRSHTSDPDPTQPSGSGSVVETGTCGASFYSEGQRTANGEWFDPDAYTAASKTLPFDTRVRVTNKANGKSVVVRINDRGPYVSGRCLDLSKAAFAAIANPSSGVITVRYEVLG